MNAIARTPQGKERRGCGPTVRFRVRSAEGIGLPWRTVARASDFGVAHDMLCAWPAPAGPEILRVEFRSDAPAPAWAGDWWMEPGAPLRRLAPARWDGSDEALTWTAQRAWVDAWERCPNALWMLRALPRSIPRNALVRALCTIVRTVLGQRDVQSSASRRAIETAEAWADGRATPLQVCEAANDALLESCLEPDRCRSSLALAAGSAAGVAYDDDHFPRRAVQAVFLSPTT